jgi:hypothetical protein
MPHADTGHRQLSGARCHVAISDFLAANADNQRLFFTFNHAKAPGDRAARKTDRDRLGWEAGILNGAEHWNKPKVMYQATFDRLRWKHDCFLSRALAGFAEEFGFDLEDKHSF